MEVGFYARLSCSLQEHLDAQLAVLQAYGVPATLPSTPAEPTSVIAEPSPGERAYPFVFCLLPRTGRSFRDEAV